MFKFIRKNAGLMALAIVVLNLAYSWYINQASLNSDVTQAAAISAELHKISGLENVNISGSYTAPGFGDGLLGLISGLFGWINDNKIATVMIILFVIFGRKPCISWVRARMHTRRRNMERAQQRRERSSDDNDANDGSNATRAPHARQQAHPQANAPQNPLTDFSDDYYRGEDEDWNGATAPLPQVQPGADTQHQVPQRHRTRRPDRPARPARTTQARRPANPDGTDPRQGVRTGPAYRRAPQQPNTDDNQ
ncbi:MAG: hypothetical protein PVI21_00835 [Candidatus Woesebacteria bacterium]